MCVIMVKNRDVELPTENSLRNCWDGNQHGAGFMWWDAATNKVKIRKGFMKWEDFIGAWKSQNFEVLDLVIAHFRITTHGGTTPANTHPFPITSDIESLKKLEFECDAGLAHNGIITELKPRSNDISDTMEFVATFMANESIYINALHYSVESLVCSMFGGNKFALIKNGELAIYNRKAFVEDNGILYSNSSFKERKFYYGNSYGYAGVSYGSLDSGTWLDKYEDKRASYNVNDKLKANDSGVHNGKTWNFREGKWVETPNTPAMYGVQGTLESKAEKKEQKTRTKEFLKNVVEYKDGKVVTTDGKTFDSYTAWWRETMRRK